MFIIFFPTENKGTICNWGDRMKKFAILFLIASIMLVSIKQMSAEDDIEPNIHLRILQTTDLHANMLGYDYEKKKKVIDYGLARTASLIKEARKDAANSLLFDSGDLLVGNALDEYTLKGKFEFTDDIHPVYKAMNTLNYDAATVGNHEFNYGLDFLNKSLKGANFPYVNANIYIDKPFAADELNYFKPFTILKRTFTDSSGQMHNLKVGVIGFITPITAAWDKKYFKGNLKIENIKKSAEHFIPIMKEKGADIIVALVHAGLEADEGLEEKQGNSVLDLSRVEGIDAILYGHSHSLFPSQGAKVIEGIDQTAGQIYGIPAVQAGYWGNHLGMIDLTLEKKNGKWTVSQSQAAVKPLIRTVHNKKIPIVESDPIIEQVMRSDHQATLKYMKKK